MECKTLSKRQAGAIVPISKLISPYGDELISLIVPSEEAVRLKARASHLQSIQLSERNMCDLELLATGAFSPLDRFMGKEDYHRVLGEMRLTSGYISAIPITLSIPCDFKVVLDQEIVLRNAKNEILALMTVEEVYEWEKDELAREVFGTRDLRHPLVSEMHRWGNRNISGRLRILHLPKHHDFRDIRLTPGETRAKLSRCGTENIVAFHN